MTSLAPVLPNINGLGFTEVFQRWLEDLRRKVLAESFPVGALQAGLAATAPAGWLICDGSAVSKTTYAELYAVVGDTYGSTTETFTLPDLRDRVLVGADTIALKATGGSNSVTLTTDQLPAHSHGVTDAGHTHSFTGTPHSHTVTDPGHTHSADVGTGANDALTGMNVESVSGTPGTTGSATTGISVDNATAGGSNSSETTGISIQNTGAGDAINITPASVGVTWLIKT